MGFLNTFKTGFASVDNDSGFVPDSPFFFSNFCLKLIRSLLNLSSTLLWSLATLLHPSCWLTAQATLAWKDSMLEFARLSISNFSKVDCLRKSSSKYNSM